jgi:hypothetical protein
MSKQAMQKALDALTGVLDDDKDVRKASITGGLYEVVDCRQAIAELRAAIDAPVDPVAWGLLAKVEDGTWNLQYPVRFAEADAKADRNMYEESTQIRIEPLFTTPPDTEAMRRDAERYRWLRDGNDAKHSKAMTIATQHFGLEWDDLIDAAIAAQGGKV